jgi:hypothetical protein
MFEELETVALGKDLPDHGLKAGDVGTVVFVYPDTPAREVEFVTRGGATVAVLTLDSTDLRPIGPDEIHHVRSVTER